MVEQLVFTSAPRGLQQGARGFTTVAATRNLSPQAIQRLESLSAYTRAYEVGDPNARLNPIAYAHRQVKLGTYGSRVLSRSAAAGTDYSGRSNTFSHHLVLETTDLCAPGPAWLCVQPDMFYTAWSHPPGYIDQPKKMPQGQVPPASCQTWERVTGDAGWGGALAAAHFNAPNTPIYIIYPPGMDMLPLVVEAMSVLPPEHRWQVTFNTYFTTPHADVECLWRCVLAGTPAEASIPRTANVLDLSRTLDPPPAGPATDAARHGLMYAPTMNSRRVMAVSPASTTQASPPPVPIELATDASAGASPSNKPPKLPASAPAQRPQTPEKRSTASRTQASWQQMEAEPLFTQPEKKLSLNYPIIGSALLVVLIGVVTLVLALGPDDEEQTTQTPPVSDDQTVASPVEPEIVGVEETIEEPERIIQVELPVVVDVAARDRLIATTPDWVQSLNARVQQVNAIEQAPVETVEAPTNNTGLIQGEPLLTWAGVDLDQYAETSIFQIEPTADDSFILASAEYLQWAFMLVPDSRCTYRLTEDNQTIAFYAPELPREQRLLAELRLQYNTWEQQIEATYVSINPDEQARLQGIRIGLMTDERRLALLAIMPPSWEAIHEQADDAPQAITLNITQSTVKVADTLPGQIHAWRSSLA